MKILIGTANLVEDELFINGLEISPSGPKIFLKSVSGLETPPIRSNSGDWSGKDGGFMSSQLYSAREITITGTYRADLDCFDEEDIDALPIREEIVNYLKIRKKFPIFVYFDETRIFYTEGYLKDLKLDLNNLQVGDFSMTFYCPIHTLARAERYGDATSCERITTIKRPTSQGHLVPETLPVLFNSGEYSSILNYKGLTETWPKIYIRGPITDSIIIQNVSCKRYMKLDLSLAENETLLIDMLQRQATVDGRSVSMQIDSNSNWWYLQPGYNYIHMSSGNQTDNNIATIHYNIESLGA